MFQISNLQRRQILAALSLVASFFIYRFIVNGSPFRSCNRVSKSIDIPQDLAAVEIIFTHNVRLANGINPEYDCVPQMKNVEKTIVPHDSINDRTYTEAWARRGLTLEELPARSRVFQVKKAFTSTRSGIETFLPIGNKPSYQLVLSDENGVLYAIAPIFMHENRGLTGAESAIAVARVDSREYNITYENFVSRELFADEDTFKWRLVVPKTR